MKFDLDTAWKDTVSLMRENASLLAVIAGVFYFIPYAAGLLWVPGLSELAAGQFDPNSEAAQAKVNAMFAGYWWVFVLLLLIQGTGMLAMLALLRRRSNPTVGEAIQTGAKSVVSYIVAQLVLGFVLGGLIFLLLGIPIAVGVPGLAILTGLVGLALTFYLVTKFSLVGPVIAMEDTLNPFSAIGRSWFLTKGNSLRLFFYYLLLFVAYAVISLLLSMVFSLVFALGGAEAQSFGQAISSSLMNALFAVLFACVLAAVYTQLTRIGNRPVESAEA